MDQAEACLAPMTTVRMLASRATAERLATRRVESMMAMNEYEEEERARPSSKNWDGRGREEPGE